MNGRIEAEQMAAEHEAKQPVAWAIVGSDGTVLDSHIYHTESLARRWAVQNGDQVLPLYRQPTLTDEEREAINMSRRILVSEPSMNPAQRAEWASTLSRLLDRTGFAK